MKTPIKQLLIKLNQTVRPNMGNALFALFLTLICETLLSMVFAVPAMMMVTHNPALNQVIFSLLMLFCALIVWLLFQYGFHILILRMVRHEYVTLGYVFYGFRKIRRLLPLMLTIATLVSVLTLTLVSGSRIIVAKTGLSDAVAKEMENVESQTESSQAKSMPAENTQAESTQTIAENADQSENSPLSSAQDQTMHRAVRQIGLTTAVYALLILVVFIRFAFVFYLHFDNSDDGLLSLFKKSARLMHKNCLRLIRLMLGAGGKNLVIALLTFILTMMISTENRNGGRGGLSVALMLFNFVYFVNAYTALLKMYFALPILYTDALQPQVEVTITDDENSQVLANTAALLAENGDEAEKNAQHESESNQTSASSDEQ